MQCVLWPLCLLGPLVLVVSRLLTSGRIVYLFVAHFAPLSNQQQYNASRLVAQSVLMPCHCPQSVCCLFEDATSSDLHMQCCVCAQVQV